MYSLLYDLCVVFCFFFFFKQKTAYEMRISDWSSDVCSSDLIFDKAVESAPDAKLREQYELSIRAVAAFERFKAVCDARLGVAGPSLNTLQEALKRIVQILGKAARAKGLIGAEEAAEALGEGGEGGDGASAGAFNLGGGDAANKAAAIR